MVLSFSKPSYLHPVDLGESFSLIIQTQGNLKTKRNANSCQTEASSYVSHFEIDSVSDLHTFYRSKETARNKRNVFQKNIVQDSHKYVHLLNIRVWILTIRCSSYHLCDRKTNHFRYFHIMFQKLFAKLDTEKLEIDFLIKIRFQNSS